MDRRAPYMTSLLPVTVGRELSKDLLHRLPPHYFYPSIAKPTNNEQAMQFNMLLHHFLLQTAALNHQHHAKQLQAVRSLHGCDLFKSPLLGPVQPLPSSIYQTSIPKYSSPGSTAINTTASSLLTPPLSEHSSVELSGEELSPPVHIKPAKACAKDQSLSRKRQHKEIGPMPKKRCEISKRYKASRKLNMVEQSPISGILIKRVTKNDSAETESSTSSQVHGDIDSMYNVVDRSEESKKKLLKIKNVIGDFICRLCEGKFSDVYELAEHRCPSIVYIEYKCPECDKVFNCPANLASHRRWHKPKISTVSELTLGGHKKSTTCTQLKSS